MPSDEQELTGGQLAAEATLSGGQLAQETELSPGQLEADPVSEFHDTDLALYYSIAKL